MNIEALQTAVAKLNSLLYKPEPGLSTWHQAVGNVFGDVANAYTSGIWQGDMLPGRPDSLCAVVITVEDVQTVAEDNGYKVTDEQAQGMLLVKSRYIVDNLLHDWTDVVWAALDDEIMRVGVPIETDDKE